MLLMFMYFCQDGWTALIFAIQDSNPEIAAMLIKSRADITHTDKVSIDLGV